ncbi:TonB-dependent receptor [Gillisia sp. M10.2A]|uniref:TonB-dependent receptor n=1 Tax=Gillisia lutea TaxID=2909668 RepID=A0ABS9ED99_9FLAO|nr:carboxypeptidase-like regulatory domain-containing protein [Gillisia lutea]MCF4100753.1 TonB-dependent receptor [Gillisia lutea]
MRKLLALALFLTTATIFAQGTLTGTVMDSDMNAPLPGATVMVVGTNTGTTTDFDGNFSLNVQSATGTIEISFIGFTKQTLAFSVTNGEVKKLGQINLTPDANALDEIVVTSFSLAIDRKTPVAVSTISAEKIDTKLGNQEYPEILKTTPGVYATKSGGGFGDAELRLRGFNSENIAVMINGVPVNDMENGRVYWSNWAGLSDVTRTMQVQRGLGASKVAVPSIGGTVNIVSKSTDAEMGGSVIASTGNDGLQKFGATVSTGISENGWAATVSASKTSGERFADGLQFEGYNYFLNISKEFNENHTLSLTAFGAPQRHGQRETRYSIEDYQTSDRGIKFNGDWGYKNGQVVNVQDNFYHKPQISLNHYWNISDKTSLSTAAYVSFGTGGGGGYSGSANLRNVNSPYRSADYQPLDLDRVVDENAANGADGSGTILYNSRNDHNWYGVLSTLSTEITEDIDLVGGIDLRYYKGKHFQEVKDLLGGQYWADDSNENDPVNLARVGDKINYYNDGVVLWEGVFTQAEYSKDDLSAFISLSASNTSYKRVDYFNYLDSDPEQETDYQNFFGYSAKGGLNYNIDNSHNIFANVGYFEKAPFFGAVFQNFQNDINEDAENQKIFSAELGYGFRTANFRANVNVYRTLWQDRTFVQSFRDQDGEQFFANILGVDALHQGLEIDVDYRATDKLTLTGMISLGDWKWNNNVDNVFLYDQDQNILNPDSPINVIIEDTPVGDAAQTTAALGLNYQVFEKTFVRADYTYFDRYFADFEPTDRTVEGLPDPWEAPDYGLIDLGLTHGFSFGSFDATINANVFNVLDTEYISDAQDGSSYDANSASVWYGFGRTYTVGAKIKF